MAEKFPGIPEPAEKKPPAVGPVEVTTLPNGVRVASQDLGGPVSAVGLFVGAGSRHETPYSSGVSHLLEHLAFKGSAMRSKYRMVRDMERTGAMYTASASRETIAYTAEGLRQKLPEMVSIVSETAISPGAAVKEQGTPEWDAAMAEIKTQTEVMKVDLKNFAGDAAGAVTEGIHAAAFHGNTLGKLYYSMSIKIRILYWRGARVFRCGSCPDSGTTSSGPSCYSCTSHRDDAVHSVFGSIVFGSGCLASLQCISHSYGA